jgi:hypothetical protein
MGFVIDKVALEQVFLDVLWFSPVSVIPLLLIFTQVSPGGWTMGLFAAQFHRDSHTLPQQ